MPAKNTTMSRLTTNEARSLMTAEEMVGRCTDEVMVAV